MYNFMVTKLIPSVTQHIEKSYNVREVQSTKISVDTCAELAIPAHQQGASFNADLILFFTAEANKSDGFVAWASPC